MIHIGTSGYVYRDWKDRLYKGVPSRLWLPHYAGTFRTVELNGTFYGLPKPGTAERWRRAVPEDFVFAAKGSRYLTHMKKLRQPEPGLARYYEALEDLRPKLAVVLWQLPPFMSKADPERLDAFLRAQPRGLRQAVEFRSPAWYIKEVCDVLEAHGAAFCEHDLAAQPPPRLTAAWRYIRFHGSKAMERKYHGRYGTARLRPWAEDLAAWKGDAYVYFNNDWRGAAVADAVELRRIMDLPRRVLSSQVLKTFESKVIK